MISKRGIEEAIEKMIFDGDTQVNLSCLESYFLMRGEQESSLRKLKSLFTPEIIIKALRKMKPPKRDILFQTLKTDFVYISRRKELVELE